MTDPKLTTDHHRNRGAANRTAESRRHSQTSQAQADRFRQRRAKDESYWNRMFEGLGIELTEQGDAQ